MIRLVIADDQSLVRGALAALLGLEGDIEVVAEVGRGDEVSAAVVLHQADVALLDVEMPGLDGIAAAAGQAGLQLGQAGSGLGQGLVEAAGLGGVQGR